MLQNIDTQNPAVQVKAATGRIERLGVANEQWRNRPDDERFLTLEDLAAAVSDRKARSTESRGMALEHLDVRTTDDDQGVMLFDKANPEQPALLNHASFGHLCARAKVPAGYLRSIPAPLAALNLSYALGENAAGNDAKLLTLDTRTQFVQEQQALQARADAERVVTCVSSATYGRIWDADVVAAVQRNCGPEWKIPAASYATNDPKRATTLYASDRDVFIFLVDDSHPIEIPNEPGTYMFRGFYVSNSETTDGALVMGTFFYERVCDNRNIWGVHEFKELRMRHTSAAPERFLRDAQPALQRYLNSSTQSTVEMLKRAQTVTLGDSIKAVREKLTASKFTKAQIDAAIDYAETRPGNAKSLWNIQQGLTAAARSIRNTDERMALEAHAGKLMLAVA